MKECSNVRLSRLFDDPFLDAYQDVFKRRKGMVERQEARLTEGGTSLPDFASGHEYFGLHRNGDGGWVFREWAPNAAAIYLTGAFSEWNDVSSFALTRLDNSSTWELHLPADVLQHGDLYRLSMHWPGGAGQRIPAYARRVVQDSHTHIANAQVWNPEVPFSWQHGDFTRTGTPLIYEAHIGMAQPHERVGTYEEFRLNILPRIAAAGYNTVQLMALLEHPYYASFGYHVSSYFAASSRFGTPEELKHLIDDAHGLGIAVITDMVHSHSIKNEVEGLSRFDGSLHQYFHEGERGDHPAWDSRCFDYSKPGVAHFLLSNCRFWLDEYHVDGFRFDGVTSMLYQHRGLGTDFNNYDCYFDESADEEAIAYLTLANKVIHEVKPSAITIAEDVSGMPGLASPFCDGGCGFDYRLAMGIPDCWFKLVNDIKDEDWHMGHLWHELTNRRPDEQTISYSESHDQALVGGKTLIFELIDAYMYDRMQISDSELSVDRGMALHKMIRLLTIATAGDGYLNFMGNEFGHPDWIDFPREGNDWSHRYARRQWHLRDDTNLKYSQLAAFDAAMIDTASRAGLLGSLEPRLMQLREESKLIVFERANLFFVFNLHPCRSVSDYPVEMPNGEYQRILDTDEERFGGQNRIEPEQHYIPQPVQDNSSIRSCITVYVPSRTALVIAKM